MRTKQASTFALLMIVIVLVVAVTAVISYIYAMQPAWETSYLQRQAQQRAYEEERNQLYLSLYGGFVNVGISVLYGLGGAIVLGVVGFVGAALYRHRAQTLTASMSPENGIFPLVELKNRGVLDPNTQTVYLPDDQGKVEVSQLGDPYLAQMALAGSIRIRSLAALRDSGVLKYAAPNKLMAGLYDPPVNTPQAQETPLTLIDESVVTDVNIDQAFEQSDAENWIMGINPHDGSLAVHTPTTNPHVAICGATGQGKTSGVAMMLIAHARRNNIYTIILDGKNGEDWGVPHLVNLYEWHELTGENLLFYLRQINRINEQRSQLLKSHGVSHIDEYYSRGGDRYEHPKLMVIFEELGAAFDEILELDIKDAGGVVKQVQRTLGKIMKRCRSRGIQIVLVDQRPEMWGPSMKTNAGGATFCYMLPMHQGKSINVEKAGLIPPHHFYFKGDIYKAWFVAQEWPLHHNLPIQEERCFLKAENREDAEFGAGYESADGITSAGYQGKSEDLGLEVVTRNSKITQNNSVITYVETAPNSTFEPPIDWGWVLSLPKDERQAWLKKYQPKMRLPISTQAKKVHVYQMYCQLRKNKTDACFLCFGSKGRESWDAVTRVVAKFENEEY